VTGDDVECAWQLENGQGVRVHGWSRQAKPGRARGTAFADPGCRHSASNTFTLAC
jgi:hypothetical protein